MSSAVGIISQYRRGWRHCLTYSEREYLQSVGAETVIQYIVMPLASKLYISSMAKAIICSVTLCELKLKSPRI